MKSRCGAQNYVGDGIMSTHHKNSKKTRKPDAVQGLRRRPIELQDVEKDFGNLLKSPETAGIPRMGTCLKLFDDSLP